MATSLSITSEEISFCEVCHEIKKVTTEAEYLCEDCDHHLCEECHGHHLNTLMTRNHTVVHLQSMQSKASDFQVSGKRPGVGRTSDSQVSGRKRGGTNRHKDNRAGKTGFTEKEVVQSVQTLSISADSEAKPDGGYQTATLKSGLNASLESDATVCNIYGVAMLQDCYIVCDFNNKTLKVFGLDRRFLYEHKCEGGPFDIACLDNSTIVVTLMYKNRVQLFSVGSKAMKELRTIKTEFSCFGVRCYNGNIFVVVYGAEISQILVYTPEGELKRRFDYFSDGNVECKKLRFLTINQQTGHLYVTDKENGVVVLDTTSGYVIAVLTTPLLKGQFGIAFDDLGKMYVLGHDSSNVVQMSADGNDAIEIISNSPRCRYPLCVKVYGNKLVISCKRSSTVSIYELS